MSSCTSDDNTQNPPTSHCEVADIGLVTSEQFLAPTDETNCEEYENSVMETNTNTDGEHNQDDAPSEEVHVLKEKEHKQA